MYDPKNGCFEDLQITISDDLVTSAEELHNSSLPGPVGFLLTWLELHGEEIAQEQEETGK